MKSLRLRLCRRHAQRRYRRLEWITHAHALRREDLAVGPFSLLTSATNIDLFHASGIHVRRTARVKPSDLRQMDNTSSERGDRDKLDGSERRQG